MKKNCPKCKRKLDASPTHCIWCGWDDNLKGNVYKYYCETCGKGISFYLIEPLNIKYCPFCGRRRIL